MEGLVNYSSEDETEENLHSKAAEFSGGCSGKDSVRTRERPNSSSDSADDSPYMKNHKRSEEEYRNDLAKPTKRSNRYHNDDEDKYNKAAKKSERDEYERRDFRESKDYAAKERNHRDDNRVHDDKSRKYADYKKYDDRYQSRYESNQNRDYRHDEKRIRLPRHDDNKSYHKGLYDMRRSRYEDKRSHNDRQVYEGRRDERRDQRHVQYPLSYQRKRSPTSPQRNSKRFDKRDEYYSTKRDGNGQCPRYSRSHSRSRSTDRSNQHSQSSSTNSRQSKELDAEVQTASLQSHDKNFAIAYNTNKLPSARNFEHLCNLPLNNQTVAKQANVANSYDYNNSGFASVGFGMANADVPQLPSYYNPQIMNPNKYAQQVQKRKLLWGAKKNETVPTKWEHAQFSQDSDGKVASKFMRLMGIKSGSTSSDTVPDKSDEGVPASSSSISTDVKSREAMFSSMEQQYEVARQVTHTMRGVGLGFGNPSY